MCYIKTVYYTPCVVLFKNLCKVIPWKTSIITMNNILATFHAKQYFQLICCWYAIKNCEKTETKAFTERTPLQIILTAVFNNSNIWKHSAVYLSIWVSNIGVCNIAYRFITKYQMVVKYQYYWQYIAYCFIMKYQMAVKYQYIAYWNIKWKCNTSISHIEISNGSAIPVYRISVYYEILNGSAIPVYRISVYYEILNRSVIPVYRILVYYEILNRSEIPVYRILVYYEILNSSAIPVYRILVYYKILNRSAIPVYFILVYYEILNDNEIPVYRILVDYEISNGSEYQYIAYLFVYHVLIPNTNWYCVW